MAKCKYTAVEFIEKAKTIHGNKYDYSNTVYVDLKTKISIICPTHGEFLKNAGDHIRKGKAQGCPKCSNKKFWTHCSKGHEFTPENTFIRKNGSRCCRTCKQLNEKKRYPRISKEKQRARSKRWAKKNPEKAALVHKKPILNISMIFLYMNIINS
jgi:hypothetical protein